MPFSNQALAFRLISALVLPYICLTQNISIVSPPKGAVIHPGQNLDVVIKTQSTTSGLERVTFTVGFNAKPKDDPTSLGRPYVGSIVPGVNATHLDTAKGTFSFNITVPPASAFLDGFSSNYTLNVNTYYTLGATYTPKTQLASVPVTIENTTSGDSNWNTGGGNGTTSNTNTGNNNSGGLDPNTHTGSHTSGSTNNGGSSPGSTSGTGSNAGSRANTPTGNTGSSTPNGQPKAFGSAWQVASTAFVSYVLIALFHNSF